MKNEFNSERELPTDRSLPAFETEYYENPNVHLEYKDNKLISITFIDDIRKLRNIPWQRKNLAAN